MRDKLSVEQKRRLLVGLHKLKEGYAGTTDISNADNLQVNEDEFTSNLRPEPKVIAKTFDTEADFDSYVKQRRGIEMTPKEIQAVSVMSEQTMPMATPQQPAQPPVQQQPQQNQPAPANTSTQQNPEDDVTADDKIRVQKSQTFMDDIQGADILSNFLADVGLAKEKPTRSDKFHMEYELTDDFGNNTTTVIKKLKEGNQFCWTAFSKYESPEEEGNPNKKKADIANKDEEK